MPLVTLEDVVDKAFDYVIIGGGSAGLILASRLSGNPATSVLVVEAGKPNLQDPLITRPGQRGRGTLMNSDYDWAFKTVPQQNVDGREFIWNRGKSLGGSSSINFCCWTIPPKEDINDWEGLGNLGWNWERYESCLRRVATYTPSEGVVAQKEAMRIWQPWGEGPLNVSHPKTIPDIDYGLYETLKNMGIASAQAPLAGDPHGVYLCANTLSAETNERSYAANTFFEPNQSRENFKVLTSASVSRIITQSSEHGALVATEVEFFYPTQEGLRAYTVRVGKEAILCAGALKSPQILELSGIGRKDVLERLGIEVKLPLEGVGENVQDHNFVSMTYELKDDYEGDIFDIGTILADADQLAKHIDLFKEGKGIFTMGITSMAYVGLSTISSRLSKLLGDLKSRLENDKALGKLDSSTIAQYEILFERMAKGAPGFELIGTSGVISKPNSKKYFALTLATNYSFSRGTIHARSKDAMADPEFDPKYFDHDFDLQVFVDMVKYGRQVVRVSPLSQYFAESPVELNPGPEVKTDQELEAWVKSALSTTWHVVGSLSMLPKDKGGVVDTEFKVYGTQNIRVVDVSIIPLHFSGHPVATAYTIGIYAADAIMGI